MLTASYDASSTAPKVNGSLSNIGENAKHYPYQIIYEENLPIGFFYFLCKCPDCPDITNSLFCNLKYKEPKTNYSFID